MLPDYQKVAILALIGGALLLAVSFLVWVNTDDAYELQTGITVEQLTETVIRAHARTEECVAAHDLGKPCK